MIRLNKIKKNSELRHFLDEICGEICADIRNRDVFIKPNLGGRYPTFKSENTDVGFLQTLCELLLGNGCKTIKIGHSSLHGHEYDSKYSFDKIIMESGYTRLRKMRNVDLVNLDNVERYKEPAEEILFEIPSILRNSYYINLSKLKTHMETTVTLSLKNQMGLVSMDNKKQMHRFGLNSYIANLGGILKPQLNIIDGIVAMEGNGPHHGKDKLLGIVICGDDMVEVDSLACKVIGIKYGDVEHLATANRLGVGAYVSNDIFDKVSIKSFQMPNKYIKKGTSLYVWPTTACSGCLFSLNKAVKSLALSRDIVRMLRLCYLHETNIVLGKGTDALANKKLNMHNVIAIGNCTKGFVQTSAVKKHVFGCPPTIDDIKHILRSG